jgi:hypothetical protein
LKVETALNSAKTVLNSESGITGGRAAAALVMNSEEIILNPPEQKQKKTKNEQ